jgi:hypothetical protein
MAVIEKARMRIEEIDKIKNEAEVLKVLDHPYIVKYKQVIMKFMCLVL